ncbi:MAG: cytochrome c biogenesis protein CcdA [Methanobacterium sp.]|uniref:cytochrome c biogenesis CcdA family protein n=1 Tax=Methanobacterium sp. TaxID=2164 RepID=UPI003D6497B7|nr:cytochrome c biogenesis protein CcdA [Methanobacterium sp.]
MDISFLFSFLAGIASVLSPCVLPLIPIVIGYSLLEKKTTEILSFVIGFSLVFAIIIILTAIFTVAINYYLYYFRLIAALIIIIIGIFFILNKNFFSFSYKPIKHGNKFIESFLLGFLTSLAWSPCYGSYLIALIAYSASSGNFMYSSLNLALFTIGFSLTIFIIAFLTSKINMDKLIKYSTHIRFISGTIITFAGIYMLLQLLGI